MDFLTRFKELTQEKCLTLTEVADGAKLPRSTISSYVNRGSIPSILQAQALANFFNVSIDYLVGREDDFGIIHSENDEAKLRPDEERLLANFNNLIPPMQSYVLDMVEALTAQPQNKKKANL